MGGMEGLEIGDAAGEVSWSEGCAVGCRCSGTAKSRGIIVA